MGPRGGGEEEGIKLGWSTHAVSGLCTIKARTHELQRREGRRPPPQHICEVFGSGGSDLAICVAPTGGRGRKGRKDQKKASRRSEESLRRAAPRRTNNVTSSSQRLLFPLVRPSSAPRPQLTPETELRQPPRRRGGQQAGAEMARAHVADVRPEYAACGVNAWVQHCQRQRGVP